MARFKTISYGGGGWREVRWKVKLVGNGFNTISFNGVVGKSEITNKILRGIFYNNVRDEKTVIPFVSPKRTNLEAVPITKSAQRSSLR